MNRGYVKLWRKSLDNGWLQNHRLWVFWSYCLLRANHKETKVKIGFQGITLKPGQFLFGRRVAAEELNMSERQIRTALAFLINAGNLTIKTTNKFSIITIVNWHLYQDMPTQNDQQNDQQVTNKRPQTRMIRSIYKCEFFSINEIQHEKYQEAYPTLDLMAEYKAMAAWLESNPNKRKTPKGYPRFVNNWLSKTYKERKDSSDWRDKLRPL